VGGVLLLEGEGVRGERVGRRLCWTRTVGLPIFRVHSGGYLVNFYWGTLSLLSQSLHKVVWREGMVFWVGGGGGGARGVCFFTYHNLGQRGGGGERGKRKWGGMMDREGGGGGCVLRWIPEKPFTPLRLKRGRCLRVEGKGVEWVGSSLNWFSSACAGRERKRRGGGGLMGGLKDGGWGPPGGQKFLL